MILGYIRGDFDVRYFVLFIKDTVLLEKAKCIFCNIEIRFLQGTIFLSGLTRPEWVFDHRSLTKVFWMYETCSELLANFPGFSI